MDLTATDEQRALRAAARELLAARMPPARLAALADEPAGWDPAIWPELAELGWLGVAVPDELGGAGMGLLEETILFEESAAVLLPAPFFATVALTLPALLSAGAGDLVADVVSGRLRTTFAWADAEGDAALSEAAQTRLELSARGPDVALTGSKAWVPDADRVEAFVVVARDDDELALLFVRRDDPGVELRPLTTIDTTRPLAAVELREARGRLLARGSTARTAVRAVRDRALTLAAAEAVGIGQRVLDLACDYAKERRQFGRAIGTYQAVSHALADVYVQVELSRSLVVWAALAVDGSEADADVAVAAAAAKAIPAAVDACERAIQVHGGIGTTWESPLHRYYKRALSLAALDGPPTRHRARVADAVLG
ncbi:acyl-CoA dehydrogenase family protein [Conexibacter arvalis]|uniref:Alkylation response protein AidB-like acyl-CoA dehydrogenase n=1 Tax=Conexibacter arvalis TaxID=912552 RepID=A0A840I6G5_9ACTN|nr:acyl-CoA dehydrogenase family protein [Conexibacter arvalis]MBB4660437.1 alkylation response protein AidB-like acyl-CoA dehydrogenase [Conexibacter arvalis]